MRITALPRVVLILVAVLFRPHPGSAQTTAPIVAGQRVTLHSRIMDEDRILWIHNPDTSLTSSGR